MSGLRLRKLATEADIRTLWVRTVPYRSMAQRFVGMLVFAAVLLLPGMTRGLPRPDVILGSTVHPFAAWAGARLAKRHRVPFIYEIRDVWPEALVQLGKLGESGLLTRILRRLSHRLCAQARLVVAPLPGIRSYLDDNGFRDVPFLWVSNGVEPQPLPPSTDAGDDQPFTFMYMGSHGNANALDEIIDAFVRACALAPNTPMRLRFVGDGPLKAQVQSYAASTSASVKIQFEDRIHRDQVIARAQEADCLVARLHDHPVYQYGISPNKLFDYQLAARPVLFASVALNNPIKEADSGLAVESESLEEMARGMVRITELSADERRQMGNRGRDHVLANYTYPALARKLAGGLDDVSRWNGESSG